LSEKGRPPKSAKAKAIELIKEQIEKQGKIDAKAISQATGYHPVHVRRLAKQIEKQIKYPETETPAKPETPTLEVEKAEVIPTAEELPVPTTPEEAVAEAVAEAEWTEENIYNLINMTDGLFPEDCRHTKEQNQALARAWLKPFNRMLQKYADQNADLYIALIVTALWLIPPVTKIIKKRQKPKPKEPETVSLGTTEIKVPAKTESREFGKKSAEPT